VSNELDLHNKRDRRDKPITKATTIENIHNVEFIILAQALLDFVSTDSTNSSLQRSKVKDKNRPIADVSSNLVEPYAHLKLTLYAAQKKTYQLAGFQFKFA
jgi:hypothetical protein